MPRRILIGIAREVEALQSEISAGGHGVEQDRKHDERAAGFAMDFRGVCFAFALFLHEGYSDAIRPSVGDDVKGVPSCVNVIKLRKHDAPPPPRSFAARLGLSFSSAAKNLAPNACSRMTGAGLQFLNLMTLRPASTHFLPCNKFFVPTRVVRRLRHDVNPDQQMVYSMIGCACVYLPKRVSPKKPFSCAQRTAPMCKIKTGNRAPDLAHMAIDAQG